MKWIQTVTVHNDQRALLFKNGMYDKMLNPGVYRLPQWSKQTVAIMELGKRFQVPGRELAVFLQDPQLAGQLTVVEAADDEYVLHYEDGRFAGLLTAGTYAFWNVLKAHTFQRFQARNPEIGADINRSVIGKLSAHISVVEVGSHETGLLFYDNVLQRELSPGRYFFWKGPVSVQVKKADLRQQQLDMTGQEILTEDKVPLRLNFVCQYKVTNPLQALQIKNFEDQVYIQLQLILREYVGTMRLDDLLRMKQQIGAYVLERLKEKAEHYGVAFLSAGVKDIILPGEVRDILNTVLLAEKRAQANLITRREETASTRSLLNTAKLMDENGTLYRLKELEFLEKICEKIGTISLTGGGSLLEGLNSLLSAKTSGHSEG